jgi:hypothetical protein
MLGKRRRRFAALAVAVMVCATGATLAQAELSAHGDLFVDFKGGIFPNALPRKARAPISVEFGGTVKTLSGERPPALRGIVLSLNHGGHLDAHGLPLCSRKQIEPSTTRQALQACGPALVGEGYFTAKVAFPEQGSFPSEGRVLAFNAIVDGQRAILAQIYGTNPAPASRIIVFLIAEHGGTFGTTLSGSLPVKLNQYGYLKSISLYLHREFVYRGRRHSYLSANCSAPAGFPGATFPFARASMIFEDGRTLSTVLTRSCKVKE